MSPDLEQWLSEHWRPCVRFKDGFSLSRLDLFYCLAVASSDVSPEKTRNPLRLERTNEIEPRDEFLGLLRQTSKRVPTALAVHTFRRMSKLQRFYEVSRQAPAASALKSASPISASAIFAAKQIGASVRRALDLDTPSMAVTDLLHRVISIGVLTPDIRDLIPPTQLPAFLRVSEAANQGRRFDNIFCEEEGVALPTRREVGALADAAGFFFVEARSKDFVVGSLDTMEPAGQWEAVSAHRCGNLLVLPKHLCETVTCGAGETPTEAFRNGQELRRATRELTKAGQRLADAEDRLHDVDDQLDDDWFAAHEGPSIPQADFALQGGRSIYSLVEGSVLPLVSGRVPATGFSGGRLRAGRRCKGRGRQLCLLGVVAGSGHSVGPLGGALTVQMDQLIRVGWSKEGLGFETLNERPLLHVSARTSAQDGSCVIHSNGWPSVTAAENWLHGELDYFVEHFDPRSDLRRRLNGLGEIKKAAKRAAAEQVEAARRVRALKAGSK